MTSFIPGIHMTPSSGAAPRKRTLLLVDDDPLCARFIGHAASDCGYDAVITISADNFKAQYRAAGADVILIDLAIPGTDGVELLRFLAEEKCESVVVIISGFDRRVVESAMRLGSELGLRMGKPLTKPIRVEELPQAIAHARETPDAAFACR